MSRKNKKKLNIILVAILLISMVLPNYYIKSAIAATNATDLFISEYIEGTSFNKALELYNGTGAAVKLSEYSLEHYSNGASTTTFKMSLSSDPTATLANGSTFVISRSDADPAIVAKANLLDAGKTVINWNGDDAVVLKHNGTIIDVIGQVGVDPGTAWGTTVKTMDQTIVRKSSVTAGDSNPSDAFDPATEWDSLGLNVFTNLGIHTMDGGSTPVETKVANVTASPAAGPVASGTKVSLATATANAKIYFTTDGSAPTAASTEYTAPINISADTTIKAIAVKADLENSDVSTFAYTVVQASTIAEVRAAALQSNVQASGVVTAVLGRAIYFQDATAGIVAYTPTDSTVIQPGDKITVSGKLTEYSTLLEIEANHENIIVTGQEAVPAAEVLTAAQLEESKEAKLVTVKNATVGALSGGNYTVTDADGTSFQVRPPSSTMLATGTTYEAITGVLSAFNGVYQLIPRNEGDILLDSSIVQAVVATPGAGLVTSGTTVTLATGTAGATIYYTLDGSEPTTASPVFTQPIVISKATTVKAVAVKAGFKNSAVATFDYAIQSGAIHTFDIQGKTHTSLFNGKTVTDVEGVVTYIDGTSRFFIQDLVGDGDNSTSDGILVFKSAHGVSIGDRVKVSGKVTEFYGEGFAEKTTTDLTITEIEATTITKNGTAPLPAPIKLGVDRIAPTEIIDNDQFATFDPEEDAIDFWESIEGMYAQVDDGKVIALQKDGLVWVVPKNYPTNVNPGGLRITATDTNPDRIGVDVRNGSTANKAYRAKMGDYFTGSIKGVVNYGYSNYKLMAQESSLPTLTETPIVRPATKITPAADKLTIGTYNVENFSTATPDAKVTKIGDAIVDKMKSPDIIGLNEIQDNNGETDTGIVDGTQSAQKIIDKVVALGGPTYAYTEITPVNNQDGGAPGGNIRVAFLYNKARVSLTAGAPKGTSTQAVGFENGKLTLNPGRIDPTNAAFNSSRKPLAAQFDFLGQSVIVVANHFNSKGGDTPLFGKTQPPVLSSEVQRHKIAAIVNNFVKDVKAKDANANVVLLGDFNDFEFTKTLEIAKGNELTNMVDKVPAEERYNYSYQGNAQELDQVLVTNNMVANTTVDILHINSIFMEEHGRASDHDPVIIQTQLKAAGEVLPPVTPPASTKVYNLNGFKTKKLTVNNAAADITVSADSVITEGIVIKSSYAKLLGEGLKNTVITLSPIAPGAVIDFGGAVVKEVVIDNANISQIRGIEQVQKWTVNVGVDSSLIKFTNVDGVVLPSPIAAPPKVNQAPVVAVPFSNTTVQVNTPVSVNLTGHFTDPDGDALTYTSSAGTILGSNLTIQTPLEGTITVTVTANDGARTVSTSFTVTVTAVPATNVEPYYQAATGKTGADLKLALHTIIKSTQSTKLSYAQVTEALKQTDEDPNNPNNVILLYTNRSQAKTTFGSGVNDWNREHVWAKSHGDFGTTAGPGTDIHHLRPTDASVNSTRGHLDFDIGGKSQGECADCYYDADSFEPPNRVKGDIARMLMYMDVRYEGDGGELNLELADKVNTYPTPFHGKKSVLLQWSKMDPPDAFEKHRNDVIQSIQGNRNPFIDHPEWADSIWPAS
ncbi:chitobiase/beta-hexosaminidase C-terminal domain-containing protein [Neobacillus drentensis]|uniref:chitobiase/beta-hexosaminidase C-terminal domain-containing protein n=1 Tax=Neobacillus drentensis TaxID=220684 RepID=UPI002FFEB324